MTSLNYSLIGTVPSMEVYRDSLETLLSRFEANRESLKTPETSMLDEQFVQAMKLDQMTVGVAIELCAQHFYGIELASTMTMTELIDTIRSMDQELAFG